VIGSRRGHRGRAGVALVGLASLWVAACRSATASASPVATTGVDLPRSYRFAPEAITVSAGATVAWTNSDQFTHNVTFDGGDPLTMSPGESVTMTFPMAGRFEYVCSLHPNDMQGSVLVT
jgi:plastocyanin